MAPLAVVTGGSRGIGRTFVLEAVRRGYRVRFTYLSREADAAQNAHRARELGGEVEALQVDLGRDDGVAPTAAAARKLGAAGLVVNNAGITVECSLETMARQAWERAVALNLTAPAFLVPALDAPTFAGFLDALLACRVHCSAIAPGPVATPGAPQNGACGVSWGGRDVGLDRARGPGAGGRARGGLKRVAAPDAIARAGPDIAATPEATGIVVVLDGRRNHVRRRSG